ncbi:HSP20-like chaperone [Conidiobolus coronatus NRRL 28638]|uniref:HSP20-like chaperone n=1 Tax=Conidiobolus coronatus (strain ATCC 28846 / CBS 209.66 / NRRL 28638) TaxID=796925 RepID=A0A137PGC8_CONC2|nr:HSP20-like chaperone [Conidiobolus coronatus NRRL 28638]|eukprot:KXN74038.1 HSP20-like chaperone [Conidiobolus coronatus NRRL 28638]
MSLQRFFNNSFFDNDKSLDRFIGHDLDRFFNNGGFGNLSSFGNFGPRVDVYENENETVIHAELPGFKSEDVILDINGDVLQISGESKRDNQYEENQVKISERSFGKFTRSIQLKKDSDCDNINAKFNNGILEVTVPRKSTNTQSRRIQIE